MAYSFRAEVIVIEFGENRPIRRDGIFDAAPNGPPASSLRRREFGVVVEIFRHLEVPLLADPGAAAPHVEQRAGEPAGETQASGDARNPVRANMRVGGFAGALEHGGRKRVRPERQPGSVAGNARTGEIALDADDEIARELVIAADLAAENGPTGIDSRRGGADTAD